MMFSTSVTDVDNTAIFSLSSFTTYLLYQIHKELLHNPSLTLTKALKETCQTQTGVVIADLPLKMVVSPLACW